jgi:hypothetical protein
MSENIITDRTVIDVMAFTKSAKSIEYFEAEAFCDAAYKLVEEYDYIFYVSPEGVKMEDNSIRETDLNYRELIDFTIKILLYRGDHKIKNLIKIPPYLSVEERVKFIKNSLWS